MKTHFAIIDGKEMFHSVYEPDMRRDLAIFISEHCDHYQGNDVAPPKIQTAYRIN